MSKSVLKVVALSDTHGMHEQIEVPEGDVLIHAGDFCKYGDTKEVKAFIQWLTERAHKHIIIVAGNHDKCAEKKPEKIRALFENENITYLCNEAAVIEGVKFWGSPITPTFLNWHFMKNRGGPIRGVWGLIPDDVDVIITHGPPYGHGSLAPPYRTAQPKEAGCLDLLNRIREIKDESQYLYPRIHVFGHIHAGYGATQSDEFGNLVFFNVSVCDEAYRPVNKATEFMIWEI